MSNKMIAVDGNEATAKVAHKVSEVVAIYPITPSTPMAELCDAWSAQGKKNIWEQVPRVIELQSEGGAAGAVHGSLQAGALTTTFTASQGLLLMIPNMFKIAGELTPAVFHVSARALAMQGLSIFGDHSDVMACRQTGFAMLASSSVQEAHDLALVAHAATLKSRIPFMHFFDGFRTSHEIMKIEELPEETIKQLIDDELVAAHRARALTPDAPVLRGTAQNPDVYFQGRETVNPFYAATPAIVQEYMDKIAKLTGRKYNLIDYTGAADAETVIVVMGSGALTVKETVELLAEKGQKVGMLNIHLYRPFPVKEFLAALPKSVKNIVVMDRCKEPGSAGEPLYQDVLTAVSEAAMNGGSLPRVLAGRYGLASKEFTPACAKAVLDNAMSATPKNHFTVGINDDVSGTSLKVDESFRLEKKLFQAMFYGLGADGTVSANKNSIKIIGDYTDNYTQGYFVYDSKKSGSGTTSHLRFGSDPIHAPYLIELNQADFVACHHTPHLDQINMLRYAKPGAVFLLNTQASAEEAWSTFPKEVQKEIIGKKLRVYVIDGYKVAHDTGMGRRINTIMQTCFFAISGILPKDEAINHIKDSIKKSYLKKGEEVVKKNWEAVDHTLTHLSEVKIPGEVTASKTFRPALIGTNDKFLNSVTAKIIEGYGDELPVSAMPVDGTYPTATSKFEKRDLALEIPVWGADLCIQCGKCAMVCPHAAIRTKAYDASTLANAPEGFKSMDGKGFKLDGDVKYTVQVSPYDCTGCGVCVEACPTKNKADPSKKSINMTPASTAVKEKEGKAWDFFANIPEADRTKIEAKLVKNAMLLEPLFEFSGACTGCGDTPYVRLASQLFGDRMIVANATGCSSIYGGNLPTTPWTKNKDGRGPAWSNSLFEDNAEFGLGIRLAVTQHAKQAEELLAKVGEVPADLAKAIKEQSQIDEAGIAAQRANVDKLKGVLKGLNSPEAKKLLGLADYLVQKSVWIMGGDGWAYDIGYGGLDHVLASGENVNILVLDTEVYSNTGGQASKSTNLAAVAQFAASGKQAPKKDLGLIAMSYKNVYVGKVAMGSNDVHTIKVFREAEAHNGPSLILAYSPCISHGIKDMRYMLGQQKMAVDSGYWPLFRYIPAHLDEGKNPFVLDSKAPTMKVKDYIYTETRYKMLTASNPAAANELAEKLQTFVDARWKQYEDLAKV
ncbi:MAG: pyruvate:ferredoxin (flavodoxin) oxidoreductase [Fibromonadaceae bacterium]|jgi:pyruvate-ferredoxin/flavodoxin oxidoreductase|nr:pyruvate:ferredoxin (flavodoxin) oxidoreductase [Fibromonadaceae bacterium]